MKLVIKTLIIVIKNSLVSLANRMRHREDRITVVGVKNLDYSIKESVKNLKTH